MYVQYKVNVSESQVDTLKDAIRPKKGATLCFPKGGIRGDHVLLLTPAQINRLDKSQVEGRRAQIRTSAGQMAKNVSYTGGFLDISSLSFFSQSDTHSRTVWLMYLVTVQVKEVFGDSTGEGGGLGNVQVSGKVLAINGKYVDYANEIQASHILYLHTRISFFAWELIINIWTS